MAPQRFAQMECTELPSLRGLPKLLVNGSVFRLESNTTRTFQWLCDRDNFCPARLTTSKTNGLHSVIGVEESEHSHKATIDPMEGVVQLMDIKPEPVEDVPETAAASDEPAVATAQPAGPPPPLLDPSVECSIVLRASGGGSAGSTEDGSQDGGAQQASAQQLCVDNDRLYNMRRSRNDIYRWECTNRPQLACGSRISTFRAGGAHVAVKDSFCEHSTKCDRVHRPMDFLEFDVAKSEPLECDYQQQCVLQVAGDGGREELLVGPFCYHLRSMSNSCYLWACKDGAETECPGRIASTIWDGRHVLVVNMQTGHKADCASGVVKADGDGEAEGGQFSDSASLAGSQCPEANVKVEHWAGGTPHSRDDEDDVDDYDDDDRRDDDDEDDDDDEEIAAGLKRDAADSDDDSGSDKNDKKYKPSAADDDGEDEEDDDEDDKPISRLVRKYNAGRRLHGPNEVVPCFTIPTARGNDKLCVEGYIYYQERKPFGDRSYWACAQRKTYQCSGRLVTMLEGDQYVVQSITIREHNHDPSATNIDKMSAHAQLRQLAVGSKCDASSVVAAVLANCTAATRQELPDELSLVKKVKRLRAEAGIREADLMIKAESQRDADGETGADGEQSAADRMSPNTSNTSSNVPPVRRSNNRYMDLDPNIPVVCSTIPSRRGNEKLCVLNYVYHLERKANNNTYHWACERRKRYDPPCLARVVTHLDANQHHVVDRRRGVRAHNHNSPPDDGAAVRRASRRPYNSMELREAESRRLMRQLETNEVIPCTTIPTARGNETLFVQGYTYHCDRRSELFVYWKCILSKLNTKERCPGRVTTTLQGEQHVVLSATLREHTHPCEDTDEERYRACAQLRQLAQETQLDADSIIAIVLQDCSEECRQKLGTLSVLKKKVVRARKGEDTASKTWRHHMRTPMEKEIFGAISRLKDMSRQTTLDARTIVSTVLDACSLECRTKLGNVIELRKRVGRVRVAADKRRVKQAAKAAKALAKATGQSGAGASGGSAIGELIAEPDAIGSAVKTEAKAESPPSLNTSDDGDLEMDVVEDDKQHLQLQQHEQQHHEQQQQQLQQQQQEQPQQQLPVSQPGMPNHSNIPFSMDMMLNQFQ